MPIKRSWGLVALLLCAACAPSPLHVGATRQIGTGGEIPRDGNGEPIWSAIRTPPAGATLSSAAPKPVIVIPGVSQPITQGAGSTPR